MKKQVLIIMLLLLNSLIIFIPTDVVKAADPSGGNIVGDTVYWENSYANLSVYPHTSTNIVRQKQWANLTWKETDNVIDVAFRFNDSLSYGKIWRWTRSTWTEVSMNHVEYNNKHYYYYVGFNVVQDTTYRFKWEYDTIANTSGKWDLFAKLNQHTIQQALENNWYVALDPWWNGSWEHYKLLTISNTYIDTDLSNFPVLVNVSALVSAKCDGGDSIRFLNTDNTTEYYYEIEGVWNNSSYNFVWVNITQISSSSDTKFLMYYNNSGASDNQSVTNVWDNNFMSVWHMNNLTDSTSNNIDLTNVGADSGATGKIGDCYQFIAVNSDFMNHATFLDVIPASDELTLECWGYHTSTAAGETYISKSSRDDWDRFVLRRIGTYLSLFVEAANGGNKFCTDAVATTDDVWHYQVGVLEATVALEICRDTIKTTGDVIGTFVDGTNHDFEIGRWYTSTSYMDGYLDEIRISNIVRNVSWINATFHSGSQTSGFLTYGSEMTNNTVRTNATTDVTNTTAKLHGYIRNIASLNGNYDAGFWYGVNSSLTEGTYDTNTTVGTYSKDTDYNYDASGLTNRTTYYVRAWISNATFWDIGNIVSFTTNGMLPVFSNVDPSNQSIINLDDDISINIVDYDGDLLDWTIETYPDVGDSSGSNEANGTKTCSISPSHSTDYIWYVNCTDGYGWTNASYNFTAMVTYVNVPTDGNSVYDATNNKLNLSWTGNTCANTYVVAQRNDTYSTSATQSGNWIRQNSTYLFWNESWMETSRGYFTIFSYNSTANMHSYNNATPLGLNIPWGALALSCYNESDPASAVNFDIEISNSDFTTTYATTGCTNIHYIDMENIPYGNDTIFIVSNNSYETRSYTYDINQNTFYNLVFYLPLALPSDPNENITYAEDYVIHVVGPQTEYGIDPPIEDAEVIIRKYVNTTEQYENVGVYVTSADGTFTVPLLPNTLYSFNISATGYYDEAESWMPVEIVFEGDRHHTFRLAPLSGEDVPGVDYDIFWDTVTFTATMNDIDGLNGTITITYSDSNSSTTNTQIYVYEHYFGVSTLIATISNTSENSFTYTTGVINTTRQHSATLFFNNTANFDVSSPVTIIINSINVWSDRTKFDFEDRAKSIFGEAGFTYAAVVSAFLAIVALIMFGPHNTGIGILACGFTLGMANWLFTYMFTGGFNVALAIYIPIIIVAGAMYMLVKDPGGHL